MHTTEIKALLDLLLDDDPRIQQAAGRRLSNLGDSAIDALNLACEDDDPRLRVRAREVRRAVEANRKAADLEELLRGPDFDLEPALVLLAATENPRLDPVAITGELDRLGNRVREALHAARLPRDRALALGQVLHDAEGFRGNAKEYYDPRNSFIDEVMRRRLGIPISLATVYILTGRRAGLEVRGIGMPTHFLAIYLENDEEILIDAFAGGRLTTREECKKFLSGQRFRDEYLRPVPDRAIIRRMIVNLVHIYTKRKDEVRLARLYRLIETLQP